MKGVYVFKSFDVKSFKIGCSENIVQRIVSGDYFTAHLNIGEFNIWYTDDKEIKIKDVETMLLNNFRKDSEKYPQGNGGIEMFALLDNTIETILEIVDKKIKYYSENNEVKFYKLNEPVDRNFCINKLFKPRFTIENIYIKSWFTENISIKLLCDSCNSTRDRNMIYRVIYFTYDSPDDIYEATLGKDCFLKATGFQYQISEVEYKQKSTFSNKIDYVINKILQNGEIQHVKLIVSKHKNDTYLLLNLYVIVFMFVIEQKYTCEINENFWIKLNRFVLHF
jgi:hypothetical protein